MVVSFVGYRVYSPKTRKTLWLCNCDCGNKHITLTTCLLAGKATSCGCHKRELHRNATREHASNWKGGRTTKNGYVFVYRPTHPAAHSNGYIPEHRGVMEQSLGRFLYPDETVHHKNGVKSDNRPENLELWVGNHSHGQRVQDMLTWASEIMTRYRPANTEKAISLVLGTGASSPVDDDGRE